MDQQNSNRKRKYLRQILKEPKRKHKNGRFLKKYFVAAFRRKNYICKQNAKNKYYDAIFLLIKIYCFLLYGRNHSPL
jgi:Rad3-related DNA helicase